MGGSVKYTCMHPLVYPSALQWYTCLRPGRFSLSVNARSQGRWHEQNTTYDGFLKRVESAEQLLLGEVSASAMDQSTYSSALNTLSSANILSSNYFILAGAGHLEGSV